MINKAISVVPKGVSVGVSTLVGAGLMGGEKMSAIPYNLEIGASAGFLCGSLAMYAISQLEAKKQVFPILVIGGLLASTYPYSAPSLHKLMQKSELNKIEYNYSMNRDTLKNDPTYTFNKNRMELALNSYNKIKPNINNPYTKQLEQLRASYSSYVSQKYRELVNGKYSNNKRTSWYSKQVQYAKANNYKNISIGNGISQKELMQGKKDLAIENIAIIFYYDKIRKLQILKQEQEQSILKANKDSKVTEAYSGYIATTKNHILEMRKNLTKIIQDDIVKANSKIYTEKEISEVMQIVGVIVEMVLTPFLMWLELLKDIRLSERFTNWRRTSRTKIAIVEAKEEVLIDHLEVLLKKYNLELTLELKRVLFLVQNIMNNDLNYLSKEDLKPKRFEQKHGSQFPKDFALPNYKNPFYKLRDFVEFFQSEFTGETSKKTTADILFAYSKYKNKG